MKLFLYLLILAFSYSSYSAQKKETKQSKTNQYLELARSANGCSIQIASEDNHNKSYTFKFFTLYPYQVATIEQTNKAIQAPNSFIYLLYITSTDSKKQTSEEIFAVYPQSIKENFLSFSDENPIFWDTHLKITQSVHPSKETTYSLEITSTKVPFWSETLKGKTTCDKDFGYLFR